MWCWSTCFGWFCQAAFANDFFPQWASYALWIFMCTCPWTTSFRSFLNELSHSIGLVFFCRIIALQLDFWFFNFSDLFISFLTTLILYLFRVYLFCLLTTRFYFLLDFSLFAIIYQIKTFYFVMPFPINRYSSSIFKSNRFC